MSSSRALPLFAVLALFVLGSCTPSIGDKCNLSTDCSLRGDRLCDTSQPGGYCTQFNCKGDDCPDTATCVLFHANVQGCGFNDRVPSRTGRTFCMARCQSDSDCRGGYVCTDPRQAPWSALIIDDDQAQKVCIVPPDNGVIGPDASITITDAAVCSPNGPGIDWDGAVPIVADAQVVDAVADVVGDAPKDAPGDAADGAVDAGADVTDAGIADAPEGG
jgi:hypothetical protein